MNTHELEKVNRECEVGGESEEGNKVVGIWCLIGKRRRDLSKQNSEEDMKTAVIIVPGCLDICAAYQCLFSSLKTRI
jgi:hypothetical protein